MPQTSKDFFIETMKDELPRFERVFGAMPKNKLDWRPHVKSRSGLEIAVSMALEALTFPIFLKTGKIDFAMVMPKMPKNLNESARVFKKMFADSISQIKKMTDKDWMSKAQMFSGKKIEWTTTKGAMAWSLLFDLIHHRGQLSTYIRPMGGKVPSIYGPSGDSK